MPLTCAGRVTISHGYGLAKLPEPELRTLLEQLREEAPDVASRMDNLIALAKSLGEQVTAGRPAAEEAETARRPVWGR